MGIHLELVDHDQEFFSLAEEPILVNDFDTSTAEKMEAFQQHLYSHYKDSDTIEESASCDGKHIVDMHRVGEICPICNTEVVESNNRPIVPSMWIRAPETVKSLITPELWIMLESATGKKEFSFLEYLTNTGYNFSYDKITAKETRKRIDKFLERGFPRGLNNFLNNFDEIIDFFFANDIIDKNKTDMIAFIRDNRARFFPKHLPLPSRVCMVVESTTSGTYIDKPILLASDAALCIASLRSKSIPLRQSEIENRTAKAIKLISTFHEVYDKARLAKKRGLLRRHVFGARLNFTGRSVITSISDPHKYDDLYIPWGMAVQLFKYHIINKLYKRGMSPPEALEFIYSNVQRYDPEMDAIFKELIAEANGGRGPACIFSRNPTLQRGSTQFFYIAKVKSGEMVNGVFVPDVSDNTVSMSALCLRAPNADFDGDQLNLTLLLDQQLTQAGKRLAPHLWALSLGEPHELSGNLEIQGPVVETVANWQRRIRDKVRNAA